MTYRKSAWRRTLPMSRFKYSPQKTFLHEPKTHRLLENRAFILLMIFDGTASSRSHFYWPNWYWKNTFGTGAPLPSPGSFPNCLESPEGGYPSVWCTEIMPFANCSWYQNSPSTPVSVSG